MSKQIFIIIESYSQTVECL